MVFVLRRAQFWIRSTDAYGAPLTPGTSREPPTEAQRYAAKHPFERPRWRARAVSAGLMLATVLVPLAFVALLVLGIPLSGTWAPRAGVDPPMLLSVYTFAFLPLYGGVGLLNIALLSAHIMTPWLPGVFAALIVLVVGFTMVFYWFVPLAVLASTSLSLIGAALVLLVIFTALLLGQSAGCHRCRFPQPRPLMLRRWVIGVVVTIFSFGMYLFCEIMVDALRALHGQAVLQTVVSIVFQLVATVFRMAVWNLARILPGRIMGVYIEHQAALVCAMLYSSFFRVMFAELSQVSTFVIAQVLHLALDLLLYVVILLAPVYRLRVRIVTAVRNAARRGCRCMIASKRAHRSSIERGALDAAAPDPDDRAPDAKLDAEYSLRAGLLDAQAADGVPATESGAARPDDARSAAVSYQPPVDDFVSMSALQPGALASASADVDRAPGATRAESPTPLPTPLPPQSDADGVVVSVGTAATGVPAPAQKSCDIGSFAIDPDSLDAPRLARSRSVISAEVAKKICDPVERERYEFIKTTRIEFLLKHYGSMVSSLTFVMFALCLRSVPWVRFSYLDLLSNVADANVETLTFIYVGASIGVEILSIVIVSFIYRRVFKMLLFRGFARFLRVPDLKHFWILLIVASHISSDLILSRVRVQFTP